MSQIKVNLTELSVVLASIDQTELWWRHMPSFILFTDVTAQGKKQFLCVWMFKFWWDLNAWKVEVDRPNNKINKYNQIYIKTNEVNPIWYSCIYGEIR